ncbi:amidohydrolase family protein [Streptomyces sp. ODS28]|uniref:amidohydrolase family protein n=1 Tax=Streptomyces sp. ODS28 TaxID=3136688 RepID=UPI0031E50E5B
MTYENERYEADGAGENEGVRRRGFLAGVGLTGTAGLLGAGAGPQAEAASRAGETAPGQAGAVSRQDGAASRQGAEPAPLRPEELERGAGHGGRRQEPLLLLPELLLLPGKDKPVTGQAVVIEDGVFRDIGPAERVTAAHPGLHPVRAEGHLLMPGFVDAHHHLTQSFGKAQSFGQPSEIFKTVWEPLERALDEESARLSAQLAALESLRGGFTTVADAGTRAPVDVAALAEGTRAAGIRCVLGKVVSDGKGGEEHLSRWDGAHLVHPSLAVPVPEDASDAVLKKTADLCEEAGAVFQIHVNEHLASVERSLKRVGRRPVEQLHHVGALGPRTLGAHATMLTPGEMRMLADSGAAVSYNPVASAWKGNAVAQAGVLREMGVRLGTGTDGTRGDGFRLVDAAESAQRLSAGLATGDSVCGGGHMWLEMGTSGGADALGLRGTTGRVAEGAAADFLLVDMRVPELTPSWDPLWDLVRLGNRDQITAVFVGGVLRLWEGRPRGWDDRALLERAGTRAREVVRRAGIHHVPVRR